MDPFIGEIRMFGFGFAPKGWSTCQGQPLPIPQNVALYSILGTTFGGQGGNFNLPDFLGSAAMHWGEGPGRTPRSIADRGGAETVTLRIFEIPAHSHRVNAQAAAGGPNAQSPVGNFLCDSIPSLDYAATGTDQMAAAAVGLAGSGLPHSNMQPYLAVNFCIALTGAYPARP